MARWEDRVRLVRGRPVQLRRGELVASLRFLADRWRWSVKKVRVFLETLEDPIIQKLETVRETPAGTVYRVVAYDEYANPGHSQGHGNGHAQGTPGAQTTSVIQQGTAESAARDAGETEQRRKHPLPDQWEPHDFHRERAASLDVDAEAEAEAFRNHHLAHGNVRADWNHAFYTWLGNTQKYGAADGGSSKESQFRDSAMVVTDEEQKRLYGR